jgi:predicted nucleotide-binding protein
MRPAALNVAKEEAESILGEHLREGNELVKRAKTRLVSDEQYLEWSSRRRQWRETTRQALAYVYSGDNEESEFVKATVSASVEPGGRWTGAVQSELASVRRGVEILETLGAGIRYAQGPSSSKEEPQSAAAPPSEPDPSSASGAETSSPLEIFLVHGRNTDKRDSLAWFLNRTGPTGLKLTILDELAGRGRTIPEKLEQHAGDASYAIVLLTGDDTGAFAGEDPQPRARQNVILELGLFTGLLGRDRVAVLHEPGVEIPSDIGGLQYISLDTDWRQRLIRELREAGWDFKSEGHDS